MNVDYISHYGNDLSAVNAARVSMDKESDWEVARYVEIAEADSRIVYQHPVYKLSDKDAKLIGYLAKNKHLSCFEHQGATLRLKVPLFVRSQIHRHRTFSYNEISRRYVKDNLEFYWPDKWRKAADNVKQGSSDEAVDFTLWDEWNDPPSDVIDYAVRAYEYMLERGCCAEQARMILPQNLYTSFYMTGNLRNWAHFLKLRLDPHAQKEVRDIAEQIAEILKPLFPVSYEALLAAEA